MSNLTLTRYEALCAVYQCYGSQEAMAEALSRATPDRRVYQVLVSRWLNQSKQLPAEYVLTAEADTGISRHWLRPDIYPVSYTHLTLPTKRIV